MERARIFVLYACLCVLSLDRTEATNPTTSSYSTIRDMTESANDNQTSGTAGSTETTPLVNNSTGPTTPDFHSPENSRPSSSSVFPSGFSQTKVATSGVTSTVGQTPGRDTSTHPAASTPPPRSSSMPAGCGPLLLCAVCMLLVSAMD